MNHGVDPTACLYIIKSRNDNLELPEEFFIKFLNWIGMRSDDTALYSIHNKLRRNMRLVFVHIGATEQKLSVQVCQIDFIEVDYVNILDS